MATKRTTEKVKLLIRETKTTFSILVDSGGHPNMDYADYAARFNINCFRSALQNPELSKAALASMLRRSGCGLNKEGRQECWPDFMTNYMREVSNGNGATA